MALMSVHEITVEWGDCDPAGIVYYPSYFKWFDQGTYRLFLKAGLRRDDRIEVQASGATATVAAHADSIATATGAVSILAVDGLPDGAEWQRGRLQLAGGESGLAIRRVSE